jgi:molybdopterin-synthase adenylyltransferase
MAGKLHHERLHRGDTSLARLGENRLVLCGAGALGSHLADNLTRQGITRLRVIDHDRIEEHNVGTQLYGEAEIGLWKVEALRNRLFRGMGVEIEPVRKQLSADNVRSLLKDANLAIDAFDNTASRQLLQEHCRATCLPCLHVGLAADYCEIIWDEDYRVPSDVGQDVCDYPLARNLVLLAVAIASEAVLDFALGRPHRNWSATLGDLAIRPLATAG